MGIFNNYPWSNFHRLNADWLLKKVQEALNAVEEMASNIETWAARITQAETNAANALTTANEARDSASAATQTADYANTTAHAAQEAAHVAQAAANQAQATADHANVMAVNAVSYAANQELTPAQQVRARSNIGSPSSQALATQVTRIDALESNSVSTRPQNLSVSQQVQARLNINAEEKFLEVWISKNETLTDWESSETFSDIQSAYSNGKNIMVHLYDVTTNIDCKTFAIINQSSSSITAESMSAYFFKPTLPGSIIGSTWHHVFMNSTTLSVQEFSARLVPDPTSNDEGMFLQAVHGRPVWRSENTVTVHATLNTSTKVVTPGEGFTFQNMESLSNTGKDIILRVVTQNNYVYYFTLVTKRSAYYVFYCVTLYPLNATPTTRYDMFITLTDTNVANYLRSTETFNEN